MTDASNPDAPVGYALTDAALAAIAEHRQRVADRYLIADDDGWTYLWCAECTAGSDDYLGGWRGTAEKHADSIAAVRLKHERDRH